MKIIHCGDIHLDSKIESNLPSNKSKQRKNEILTAFCDMVDYAEANCVTAVIIAGDLFDTDVVSPTTRDIVLKKIEDCSKVDFLYLCGNHDAGKSLKQYETPSNLKFFSDSWMTYVYENVAITGVELTNENCRHIYGGLHVNEALFNIVSMHGQVSTSSGEDMVNIKLLSNVGIDYLALGHYHSHKTGKLGNKGIWSYCGCLEGRGFDECGDKGFILLEIDDNNSLKVKFQKISHRDIKEVLCDITGLFNAGDMLNKIKASTADIDASSMVKVVLEGNIPPDSNKDIEYFKDWLKERFWFAKIKDNTRLLIQPKDYLNDISLKGEFIRLCMELNLTDEQRDRVIECGLNALGGREVL